MNILRLTALSIALVPLLVPQTTFSQTVPSTTNVTQSPNGQSVGTSQPSYTTPGTNLQTPGTNLQTPGTNLQTPGTNLQTPGVGSQTTGVSSQSAGVGSQSAGVGSQSAGVGSQSAGVGSQSTGVSSQSAGVGSQSAGVGSQTTGGQSVTTGQSSLGTTGSTGTSQTVNGQAVQSSPSSGTTGSTQTTGSGQAIGPSLPLSTKVPGAEQTFVNGRSTGTTQVAPPIDLSTGNPAVPTSSGTQVGPNSVLYPPQIIQGVGGTVPPAQPAGTPASGAVPIQPRTTPTVAPRTAAPATSRLSPTQLQPGQGTLDAALEQATCAQNWQQAIRLVNTAIATAPASQAGYRSQLVSYRTRLQNLRAKGVRVPNWAQQCRGGNVANASPQ